MGILNRGVPGADTVGTAEVLDDSLEVIDLKTTALSTIRAHSHGVLTGIGEDDHHPKVLNKISGGTAAVGNNSDTVLATFVVTNGQAPIFGVSVAEDVVLTFRNVDSIPGNGDASVWIEKTAVANQYNLHLHHREGAGRNFDWEVWEGS